MNKSTNTILRTLAVLVGVCNLPLIAQDDGRTGGGGLGNIQLEVTRAFEGQVQQPRKLNDMPRIDDTLRSDVSLDYKIRSRPVFTDFTPEPLSPARIRRVPVDKLPKMMVRLGLGNHTTPLAEFAFNNERSRNQSWGFHGRHFSTQQGVSNLHSDYARNNFLSENKLGGHYRRFFRNYTLSTQAEGFYYANDYYGMPEMDFNRELSFGDPLRQSYLGAKASVALFSSKNKQDQLFDNGRLGYHYIQDRFGMAEHYAFFPTKWSFPVMDQLVKVDFNTILQNTVSDTNGLSAEYLNFSLFPHITHVKDNLSVLVGLHFIYNYNDVTFLGEIQDQRDYFLSPEVIATYKIFPNVMEVYGGIDYDFSMNNMADMTRLTPWLNPGVLVQPTRKTDFYGGTNFLIMPGLSLDLRASYTDWRNKALLYRDPFSMRDPARLQGLDLRYVSGSELGVSANLQYQFSDDLRFGTKIAFSEYQFTFQDEFTVPYHLAPWRGGFNLNYKYLNKIVANVELTYIGQREAFYVNEQPFDGNLPAVGFPEGFDILPGFWDLDLKFDYNFNPNLTVFLKVHNALASNYDMFLGYGAQRFLGIIGLSFRL
ncbi:MAG: TonB-dependent receptor [Cryomorphaceae bacterium]|nr:TonB-dependent receptor [Cryomorphaceae bacterium]